MKKNMTCHSGSGIILKGNVYRPFHLEKNHFMGTKIVKKYENGPHGKTQMITNILFIFCGLKSVWITIRLK